jgi:hypothetical protein
MFREYHVPNEIQNMLSTVLLWMVDDDDDGDGDRRWCMK